MRLAEEKLKAAGARIIESCVGATAGRRPLAQPGFLAEKSGIRVRMCVRQGIEFWGHIADPVPDAYLELCCALTAAASPRAALGQAPKATRTEQLLDVVDVPAIAKAAKLPGKMSAAQLPWLLLFVRHYVDDLTD